MKFKQINITGRPVPYRVYVPAATTSLDCIIGGGVGLKLAPLLSDGIFRFEHPDWRGFESGYRLLRSAIPFTRAGFVTGGRPDFAFSTSLHGS